MGQKNFGTCKLCLQKAELQNSHVISEFLYKPTYDDKGRAIDANTSTNKVRYAQKGLRERLLCSACETHLNVVETYFANVWYGKTALPKSLVGHKGETLSVQVDYANFKLFHLSILWRASISSLPNFLRVDLGPHEETLRQKLLASDLGQEHQYGIRGQILANGRADVVHDLVGFPQKTRAGLYTEYMFMFGGCRWFYSLANPNIRNVPNTLNRDGTLTLYFESFENSSDAAAIGNTLKKQPNASKFVGAVVKKE